MFHRLLVPLDGSVSAESAIPVAARIARVTGGTLLFLRVILLPVSSSASGKKPFFLTQKIDDLEYQHVSAYLESLAQAPALQDLTIQTQVMAGLPPQAILSCIETQEIDLVILYSQGETERKRWALGNVAQKVIRRSGAPILILHEVDEMLSHQSPAEQRPMRVLVALDGSVLAKTVLEPAAMLATALSAPEKGELHLVQILSPSEATSSEEASSRARQRAISAAQMDLHQTAQTLQENMARKGACVVATSVVVHADIAETLICTAEAGLPATEKEEGRRACDVLALTTHGQSGIQRWVLGSIAEYLLDGTRLPLLVVRPPETKKAIDAP